jgi:nicotinamidase-related amidase
MIARMAHAGTALLIMDVQPEIVERFGADRLPAQLARAATAARGAGARVIFVKAGFRPGYPEINPRNRQFAPLSGSGAFIEGASSTLHSALAPQSGDVVVTKHRVSAFAGTDLEMILHAASIRTLVLSGISTSGCVLSTLRQAADLDFSLSVLSDGCVDDPEIHQVLCEKLFPVQAEVLAIEDWIARMRA